MYYFLNFIKIHKTVLKLYNSTIASTSHQLPFNKLCVSLLYVARGQFQKPPFGIVFTCWSAILTPVLESKHQLLPVFMQSEYFGSLRNSSDIYDSVIRVEYHKNNLCKSDVHCLAFLWKLYYWCVQ